MSGLKYKKQVNKTNKSCKIPISVVSFQKGSTLDPNILRKDITVNIDKHADYSNESERDKQIRIASIQRFLGVPVTGKWNKKTNRAFKKVLAETGFTPQELSERVRIGQVIDLKTGKTHALMRAEENERKANENRQNNQVKQVEESSTWDAFSGALSRALGNLFTSDDEQKEQRVTASDSKTKKNKTNQNEIEETYELLGLTPDANSPTKSLGHSFVHTFDNDRGGSYIIGRKIAELKNQDGTVRDTTYDKSAGVAHFLMDADISKNQKKANVSYRTIQGDLVESQYDDIFLPYLPTSPEEYIMQFKPKNDNSGEYLVRYKKLKDTGLTIADIQKGNYISKDGWDTRYPVRSFDPENIDWDDNTGSSFTLKTPTIRTKDGKSTPIPSKKSDLYSRYSGASVVFLVELPSGRSLAKDVGGSVQTIREQYDKLKQEYPNTRIRMLVHDAGSYSFKPVAYDGLKQSSYVDFNKYNRGYSGAGLHIPTRLVPPETLELIRKAYQKKDGGLIFKKGGILNQGNQPMEFVTYKTNKDHTLDGYKLVNGKLKRDKKSSVKGYLKPIEPSEINELNQYGKNLYSRLKNGGKLNERDVAVGLKFTKDLKKEGLFHNNEEDDDEREASKKVADATNVKEVLSELKLLRNSKPTEGGYQFPYLNYPLKYSTHLNKEQLSPELQSVYDTYYNYVNSDLYRNRLKGELEKSESYEDDEIDFYTDKLLQDRIDNLTNLVYNESDNITSKAGGLYNPIQHLVTFNNKSSMKKPEVAIHEMSHGKVRSDKALTSYGIDTLSKNNKLMQIQNELNTLNFERMLEGKPELTMKEYLKDNTKYSEDLQNLARYEDKKGYYLTNPSEIYAALNTMRLKLKDLGITKSFGDDITVDELLKLKENINDLPSDVRALLNTYEPEDIVKMNNTVAKRKSDSQPEMLSAKQGGLLFKKGGTVRDMPCNKPTPTPNHKTKSHVVKACEGGKQKIIRFGQQGVVGSPKKTGESEAYRKRRLAFKARHAKNIAKGKMSAAYWANKVKW